MKGYPKTILVVDDDPDIALMLQALLEEEGYRVRTEKNHTFIERLLPQELPDMFIIDLLISGINGLDLTKRLKQQEETQQIPVLMLSAHPSAEQLAWAAGVDDFLAKPFEIDDLLIKVKHALKHEM